MVVFRSLRARIFIMLFLVGLIPCIVLQVGILRNYERRAVEVREAEVQTQLRAIANHLMNSGYMDLNAASSDTNSDVDSELREFSTLYDGRVLVISRDLRVKKDTYSISEGKTIVSEDVVRCLTSSGGESEASYDNVNGYIEVVVPIMSYENMQEADSEIEELRIDDEYEVQEQTVASGVILAAVSTETIQTTLNILSQKAFLLELIMIVIVFAVSILMSIVFTRPFDKLSNDIAAVKAGYSSDPIRAPWYLETQHIADSFNQVLGRMNALDQSRDEFVSNVSHELKTPMTSMKLLSESLLNQSDVPEEVYQEFLFDIDNEIDRENKIINDLLELVKLDKKKLDLEISTVDINVLCESVLKRIQPIAQEREIRITLISEREVTAEVDETKMMMIVTNLVENAVKYNRDRGRVTVTVNSDHQYFTLKIEDTGVGIPKDSVGRIFERFYRVDKSRSREVGGTGLGLSITKSAVLQHHGTIDVVSEEGKGTTFFVRIPRHYSPSITETRERRRRFVNNSITLGGVFADTSTNKRKR